MEFFYTFKLRAFVKNVHINYNHNFFPKSFVKRSISKTSRITRIYNIGKLRSW